MDTQSHPEELQETLTINNLAELDDDYRTSASIENCFSSVPLSFSAVFYAITHQINSCFYSYNQFLLAFTEGILSSLSYPIIYRII